MEEKRAINLSGECWYCGDVVRDNKGDVYVLACEDGEWYAVDIDGVDISSYRKVYGSKFNIDYDRYKRFQMHKLSDVWFLLNKLTEDDI